MKDAPTISDFDYDRLFRKVRDLEEELGDIAGPPFSVAIAGVCLALPHPGNATPRPVHARPLSALSHLLPLSTPFGEGAGG